MKKMGKWENAKTNSMLNDYYSFKFCLVKFTLTFVFGSFYLKTEQTNARTTRSVAKWAWVRTDSLIHRQCQYASRKYGAEWRCSIDTRRYISWNSNIMLFVRSFCRRIDGECATKYSILYILFSAFEHSRNSTTNCHLCTRHHDE